MSEQESIYLLKFAPIFISTLALIVSGVTFYFNFWRKQTKALLLLNSRLFGADETGSTRELSYSISNLGNQEIYIKEIDYYYGDSHLGPYRHRSPFLRFPSECKEIPLVIKPREVKPVKLIHRMQDSNLTATEELKYKYRIVFIEAFSADGNRYDFTHEITDLKSSDVELNHPVWKSVGLKKIKAGKSKAA